MYMLVQQQTFLQPSTACCISMRGYVTMLLPHKLVHHQAPPHGSCRMLDSKFCESGVILHCRPQHKVLAQPIRRLACNASVALCLDMFPSSLVVQLGARQTAGDGSRHVANSRPLTPRRVGSVIRHGERCKGCQCFCWQHVTAGSRQDTMSTCLWTTL